VLVSADGGPAAPESPAAPADLGGPAVRRTLAGHRTTIRGVGYGVAAGLAFGTFFLFIRNGGESGALWPVVVARLAGTLVFLASAAGIRVRPVSWCGDRRVLLAALGAGVLDSGANICYVFATRAGLFGLAVVLTSLYPGITVLLARIVFGERMRWARRAGLALAAAGILLVTV
jgi:drug/metabolite transporter (DMT)-like permease